VTTMKQSQGKVLVVDDDSAIIEKIQFALETLNCDVEAVGSATEFDEQIKKKFRGVILLDVRLPDGNGLTMLDKVRQELPNSPVILMTGTTKHEGVVTATLAGAFDFITKNNEFINRILISTRNALDSMQKEDRIARLTNSPAGQHGSSRIISKSPKMDEVLTDIGKLGGSKVSVLIQGASGTGKEVVAHAIHEAGPRRTGPFIAVNCAGIPDSLLESELLGHERGAFTGAVARKIGRFEAAHGGTIFLDEIGEMSLPLQAKLLRVVQDGRFERLGGTQTIAVDVRVLSATNRNLADMVGEGTFREDLYYRLAVFTLNLPALAERPKDVEPLVQHFLRQAVKEEGKSEPKISPEVMALLETHPWPGNVRQLQNVIKHAVVVGDGEWMTIGDLPASFRRGLTEARERMKHQLNAPTSTTHDEAQTADLPAPEQQEPQESSLPATPAERLDQALERAFPNEKNLPNIDELEMAAIRLVQKRLNNNRKRTAKVLGMSRATLYRRLDGATRRRSERS